MQGPCRCVKEPGSMLTHVEDENVDPASQHREHESDMKVRNCICPCMQVLMCCEAV